MNKSGKVLITGVAGGIGSEIARTFLQNDWLVYGVDSVEAVPDDLTKKEGFTFCLVDISVGQDVEEMFNSLLERIDVVINCAGVLFLKDLKSVSEKELFETISTNLIGSFHIAKYSNSYFLNNKKKGVAIYIGSRWGCSGSKKDPAYAASKSGLRALVKSLQSENLDTGIRHMLLSPRSVFTDMSLLVDREVEGKIIYAKDIADLCLYIANTPDNLIFEEISIKAFPYDFINP